MRTDVLNFIALIRKTFGRYKEMSGGCYKFHLILKQVFGGKGFYNSNHVITKIDNIYYDIDGEIIRPTDDFLNIEEHYGYEHMERAFGEHI